MLKTKRKKKKKKKKKEIVVAMGQNVVKRFFLNTREDRTSLHTNENDPTKRERTDRGELLKKLRADGIRYTCGWTSLRRLG